MRIQYQRSGILKEFNEEKKKEKKTLQIESAHV